MSEDIRSSLCRMRGAGFKVIVIDPPWPVKKIVRKCRPNQTERLDYPTMTLEEIKALGLRDVSAEDSCVFLWTTQAFLPHAFDVLCGWGFKYQRCLAWDKGNGMCLFGFHHRTEFCLFGYRGKIEMYPHRKAIPTSFSAKSPRHSAKPDEFYRMLAELEGPRLDIFARQPREGWTACGNEIETEVKHERAA